MRERRENERSGKKTEEEKIQKKQNDSQKKNK